VTQRVLVEESLSEAGFETAEAEDGALGLTASRELLPDLIILDVIMPEIDGFDVCRTLRRDPQTMHIPILMVTGLEDEQSIEKGFEAGATNFLTKPINWAILGHHIRYLLRSSGIERELRTAKLAAEAASRAKTELLANVSHELRTPLNAVIGFSELIMTGMLGPHKNQKQVEYAKDIRDSGRHLLDLINDLLDLSKIEIGLAELCEDTVDVRVLIQTCLKVVKVRAAEAQLTLQSQLPHQALMARVDERKLKQMILNLVSNAIKFTPARGEIGIAAFLAENGDLIVEITDNGIGIASDDIPRIMEPFVQVDAALDRKYTGTGLGLPLTKTLIELHGGSLKLDSTPGRGTIATLQLPAWRVKAGRRKAG
jgi:signal transduction histidine kinase